MGQGMVVLSGYPNMLYDRLGWESRDKSTRTFYGSNKTAPRTERIWLNPAAAGMLVQGRLL